MGADEEKGRLLREASQNVQSAEQGVCRHLTRLVSKFKKVKHLPFTVSQCRTATFKGISKLSCLL